MRATSRLDGLREHLRGSLWFLPTVAVTLAVIAGALMGQVTLNPDSLLTALVFGGGASGARGVLEVVAGSTITVTSVTFSLTVVALVTASSLYSPRVLRTFLRDRGNQVVLSTFLATFSYSLVVLRTIRAGGEDAEPFVPRVAVTIAVLLGLASLAALVYFIHHITQSIRVETIMTEVERETLDSIEHNYGESQQGPTGAESDVPDPPSHAVVLHARRSGYVQAVSPDDLLGLTSEHDLVVWFRRTAGERVTAGTTLAWVWRRRGGASIQDPEELEEAVDRALQLGQERSLQQDVSFGLRQLVDISIKALSPSVNDPTTAVDGLGHLSVLMCSLATRSCGQRLYTDDDGDPRVGVPRPSFADYLGLACSQIALYGAGDITAVRGVMRLLEDVAAVVSTDDTRQAVAAQVKHTLAHAGRELELDVDKAAAEHAANAVRQQLADHVPVPASFTL